ncbi:hypothetical protein F4808DRAFT_429962 [Astrocystis sublimbata]|nr:hypothetical protein F4808DRAFT_429962 [Astrocystis sublimbata]
MPPPSTPPSPPEKPKHGVFQNEKWLCNCDPRLDAVVKTVSKKSKNHGRRFYACPKYGQGNHCDMFLFVEDARPREYEYLKSNGRSETKRQMTITESMNTPSKNKDKRRSDDATPLAHVVEPQADMSNSKHSVTTASAKAATASRPTTSTSYITISPDSSPSTAQTSTLKASSGDSGNNGKGNMATLSRTDDFYDTTSDEDESQESRRGGSSRTIGTIGSSSARPGTVAATPTAGAKRKRALDEEEDLLGDLSSDGEEELVAVTDRSSRSFNALGKRPQHQSSFTTPSALRTTDVLPNGLPTPSLTKDKSVKKVLFRDEVTVMDDSSKNQNTRHGKNAGASASTSASAAKRQRLDDDDDERIPATASKSPSPATHASRLFGTDATIEPSSTSLPPTLPQPQPQSLSSSSSPSPGTTSSTTSNLTTEIMALLQNSTIDASVRSAVRQTLDKHVSQAKGYERGRDAARKAAKEADDRAAALQGRVDELEKARREVRGKMLAMWERA